MFYKVLMIAGAVWVIIAALYVFVSNGKIGG